MQGTAQEGAVQPRPAAAARHTACSMPVPELQVPVVGQWMTKITSLLRRLIKLRESAPDEKSLVFSQFPDALELVARALRINGFDAAQLSTRQKV